MLKPDRGNCCDASFEGVRNLLQLQIKTIIFGEGHEPYHLPRNLQLPTTRRYQVEVTKDGKRVRRFIKSDAPWSEQLVDEWVKKEIAEIEKQEAKFPNATA